MTLGFSELTKRVYIQHGKEKKDVTEQFRAIESKEISLLQEQLRLSEENNKVLLEKLKGGEETENNGEMEDYINITFSLNIDTFNRFLKALKCGDPELWAEIKDDIKERLEDACKRAKLKPHQSN
jgi:hypothetical protein